MLQADRKTTDNKVSLNSE